MGSEDIHTALGLLLHSTSVMQRGLLRSNQWIQIFWSMSVWHLVCHNSLVFNHELGKRNSLGHVRQKYDENLPGECVCGFGEGLLIFSVTILK